MLFIFSFLYQELYIQQLQSELSQLRKRSTALDMKGVDELEQKILGAGDSLSVSDYKSKLKSAVSKIVQLSKENQQLIESNNRLRAELKCSGKVTCFVVLVAEINV